ncbi:MAG: M23 family metallopeptidase [Pseudomonadota bacterium]
MDNMVMVLQVIVPLALLLWLVGRPSESRIGFLFQTIGTGLSLVASWFTAIWVMPPLWVFYIFAVLWLLGAGAGLYRMRTTTSPILPIRRAGWAGLAFSTLLTISGGYVSCIAYRGLTPQNTDVVEIRSPFPPGMYMVAHGGFNEMINGHAKIQNLPVERSKKWRGQTYGLDFFKIDELGLRVRGWRPTEPKAYVSYGTPIYAPCSGSVISRTVDLPDMPVPVMDRDNMLGNHVLLDCGTYWVLLAHFRQGTVSVSPGDQIEVGTQLGELGNSGNSSEPHLHIHAQRPASSNHLISGEPLAMKIGGRFLVRNDILTIVAR